MQNLHLTDLFTYIEKLFTPQTHNYRYDIQNETKLVHDTDYWIISELLDIQDQLKNTNSNNLKIQFTDILKPLVSISRSELPNFSIPAILTSWVNIDLDRGELSKKDLVLQQAFFDDSQSRVTAFKSLSQKQEALFNDPSLPPVLKDWIVEVESDSKETRIEKIEQRSIEERFEENKARVVAFKELEKLFIEFLKKYEIQRRTNRLYDSLHRKYFEIKGQENKKISLSLCLIKGNLGTENYINYLIDIPLKLNLSGKVIEISSNLNEKTELNLDFLALLDYYFENNKIAGSLQRKEQIIEATNKFTSQEIVNPLLFSDVQYLNLVDSISSIFPKSANKYLEDGDISLNHVYLDEKFDDIEISFSPMIRVLEVDTRIYIKKDATNIINKILEIEKNGTTMQIPDFFKKLFDVSQLQSDDLDGLNLQEDEEPTTHDKSDILFPLPSNDEQVAIAKRLEHDSAVTVMGPPGTGKSHTIANLISNFVSKGENILVVSQNSKALNVLYNKLPKEVQDLAVTFEDKKTASSDLQSSVQTILSHLSRDYSEESIKDLEKSLSGIKTEIIQSKEELYSVLKQNNVVKKLINFTSGIEESKNLQEWAELYYENPFIPEYLKDKLKAESDTETLVKQTIKFKDLCKPLSTDELNYYNLDLVPTSSLISTKELKDIIESINDLKDLVSSEIYEKYSDRIITSETSLIIEKLKSKIDLIEFDEDIQGFVDAIKSHKRLKSVYLKSNILYKKISEIEVELEDYKIIDSTLSNYEPEAVLDKLNDILSKTDHKISLKLRLNKLDRLMTHILEAKINGTLIQSSKDIEILIRRYQIKKCVKKIDILFENHLGNVKGEISLFDNWKTKYKAIKSAYLINKYINSINSDVSKIKVPKIDSRVYKNIVQSLKQFDEIHKSNIIYESEMKLINLVDLIIKNDRIHPLLRKLCEALNNKDISLYKKIREEYEIVEKNIILAKEIYDHYLIIRTDFPETAEVFMNLARDRRLTEMTMEIFEKEIAYMRLKQILNESSQKISMVGKLNEKLHNLQESIYRKTSDLVVQKAWKHKVESINDDEKRALGAWHFAVTAMGRGYGKLTERFREDAQKNLNLAKSAVPIWIMSLYTAIRYFDDVTPGQFDVLIIDEASQCDITALNLIFRAKKIVIVGDDNQTAVEINHSRFPLEYTTQVLDQYLHGHRFKEQFNINANNHSIYALSTVLYPNTISLVEHFRCLPEIINYSKRYVYNNKIVPLRTTSNHPFGKPVEVFYVEDSTEEKENIVTKVREKIIEFMKISSDNSIKLPSIGILCLDSSNQKHKQSLQTMLRQDELISNSIDEMDLLIGSSREFQGDERDIMILTTTVSHSINDKGEMRPPSSIMSEEYKRIYNVAASRAKDKSILIHSIHPDAISLMNKDCWRFKLINYYENVDDEEFQKKFSRDELLSMTDPNSGDFEKSTCNFLIDNNYGDYIKPQYQIGPYKIDFALVLPGEKDSSELKLAIECDGYQYHSSADQVRNDIDRQLILERAGWQFYRLNSIDWYGNRTQTEDVMRKWLIEKSKR